MKTIMMANVQVGKITVCMVIYQQALLFEGWFLSATVNTWNSRSKLIPDYASLHPFFTTAVKLLILTVYIVSVYVSWLRRMNSNRIFFMLKSFYSRC